MLCSLFPSASYYWTKAELSVGGVSAEYRLSLLGYFGPDLSQFTRFKSNNALFEDCWSPGAAAFAALVVALAFLLLFFFLRFFAMCCNSKVMLAAKAFFLLEVVVVPVLIVAAMVVWRNQCNAYIKDIPGNSLNVVGVNELRVGP